MCFTCTSLQHVIYVPGWRRLVRSGKAYLSLIQLSVTSRITQSRDPAHRGNQGLDYPRGLVEISTAGKGLYTYQCPPPPHVASLLPSSNHIHPRPISYPPPSPNHPHPRPISYPPPSPNHPHPHPISYPPTTLT